jgi:hypothetical protein
MEISFFASGAFRGPTGGPTVLNNPTSLQFGPDGRLYVAEQNGAINAFTVERRDGAWTATAHEELRLPNGLGVVTGLQNRNDDGAPVSISSRQVTGIAVAGTADRPVLYVTSSDPRIGGTQGETGLDTNSGVLTRVSWTGTAWETLDLVRGLPRAEENHAANGLVLDAATNTLYVTQGGNTNNGAPSRAFAYQAEYALSGTILAVDLTALAAAPARIDPLGGRNGTARAYVYDLPTLDDPTVANGGPREDAQGRDLAGPWGGNDGLNMAILPADAPLRIFADGLRNPYDIVLRGDGRLFTVDNGSNDRIGGNPITDAEGRPTNAPNDGGVGAAEPLFELVAGGYYGHPAPIRANPRASWTVYGDDGLPDPTVSPGTVADLTARVPEGVAIAPGFLIDPSRFTDDPERLARSGVRLSYDDPSLGALAIIGSSSNGLVEYVDASVFGGALAGDLFVAQFNGSIGRLDLSADGRSAVYAQVPGLTGISLPLDVTIGPGGTLWVATLGDDDVKVFAPAAAPPPPPSDDIDGDGVANALDPFQRDPSNGTAARLSAGGRLVWDFDPDQDGNRPGPEGFGGGLTGVMIDGATDFEAFLAGPSDLPGQSIRLDNVKFITAALGGSTVIEAPESGTPVGPDNDGAFLFHTGFAVDPAAQRFTVAWTAQNPGAAFSGAGQRIGGYLGTGDQSAFLAVIAGPDPAGEAQVILEDADVPRVSAFFDADGLFDLTPGADRRIRFELDVDRPAQAARPRLIWETETGEARRAEGPALSLAGTALLDAIEGRRLVGGAAAGVAAGLYATDPGDAAVAAVFDGVAASAAGGAAVLAFSPTSQRVQTSSNRTGAFTLTNTGDTVIERLEIDLNGALYPDVVFDPFGLAGDTVAKGLTIDSAGGTGVRSPSSYIPYLGAGGRDGFDRLVLLFDPSVSGGFQPGETVAFSVDIDTNSIAGAEKRRLELGSSPLWDVGGVSGAEVIGARFTVDFAGGGAGSGQFFGTATQGGARGVAREAGVGLAPPTVAVNGLAPGETGVYGSAGLSVVVQGPAGATARIVLTKGFIQPVTNAFFTGNAAQRTYAPVLQAQLDALAASAFPANNAVEFQTVDVTLTGAPQDISALFDLSGVAALDFPGEDRLALGVVAALIEPTGLKLPLSPVTRPVYLRWENAAPTLGALVDRTVAEGGALAASLSAVDPDGPESAIAFSAVIRDAAGAAVDPASYRIVSTGPGFAELRWTAPLVTATTGYTVSVSASDGRDAATADFAVTVRDAPLSFRVEAEALELAQGFSAVNGAAASGGRFIAAVGPGEQIARHAFAGSAGLYDLAIGHFDENDGVARMAVFVNGAQVDAWLWDGLGGAASPTAASRAVRTVEDLALRAGDVVELRGFGAPGEPLRTDFLDFTRTGNIPAVPAPFRIEAESLALLQGFAVAAVSAASGRGVIAATGSGEQIARAVFAGPAGVYDIGLGHFDENDGVARMAVFVNDAQIDDWRWNGAAGSDRPTPDALAIREIDAVSLRPGDVVELRGFGAPGEPLRTDFLDFAFVDHLLA